MGNVPVNHQAFSPSDYYQLQPEGVEWLIIIQRLIDAENKITPLVPGDVYVVPGSGKFAVLYLRRERFSPDALGRTIGADPAKLGSTLKINLHRIDDTTGLPNPTVDYWGMG